MNILEICTFSAGGCGVWARVKRESLLLSKLGHDVTVFTTNREKGTWNVINERQKIGSVKVIRFPAIKLGGESFTYWNFYKEAKKLRPDLIIVHSYRHTHTLQALHLAKKIKCKIFLVTHAPFNREDSRKAYEGWIVNAYDYIVGKVTIKKFDKVLAISKWEIPYLNKLGLKKEDIVYSPNGISDEFFRKPIKEGDPRLISYTGRIAPIKNLEIVIRALALTKNKSLRFHIFGPAEPAYKKRLLSLISELELKKRVLITDKRYSTKEQIAHIDKGYLFILPSLSEGMPQVLVEALARKRVVISSNIPASKDIIKDRVNGFIFNKKDPKELANILDNITLGKDKRQISKIRQYGFERVKEFDWNTLIIKLDSLVTNK
ncbi:glycosyltransferase family 4 protein [Candidatus Pacearchaeota archaeon]|nr:glycosyltransferase family 4 protein [Candidatus Pacearchaeota archaeon]